MTLITAMTIQGNKDSLKIFCHKSKKDNKWMSELALTRHGCIHSIVLSTSPVFDSEKAAREFMENTVIAVNKLELLTIGKET